ALLTAEAVTVPNATATGSWTDNGDGTYGRVYTATTVGTALKAALKLTGWDGNVESTEYAIKAAAPELKGVEVNGYTFAKDAGFPTTGFTGAKFTLLLTSGSAADFTWSSDATSWVAVNDGVVTFTGKGNGNKVTITGTPKNEGDKAITFSFTLKNWFINGNASLIWSKADEYCTLQGASLPTEPQLTNAEEGGTPSRTVGNMWSEWGGLGAYTSSGFSSDFYWASSVASNNRHHLVNMQYGSVGDYPDDFGRKVMCHQSL
ncbi:inverse autotransporter beta domain-containing protein, partial [Enterobacter wuhouensis]